MVEERAVSCPVPGTLGLLLQLGPLKVVLFHTQDKAKNNCTWIMDYEIIIKHFKL